MALFRCAIHAILPRIIVTTTQGLSGKWNGSSILTEVLEHQVLDGGQIKGYCCFN